MATPDGGVLPDLSVTTARIWVDAITYAVVVALLASLLALILGIATGGGFVRGKQLLFVFGWATMAYATWELWPSSPAALEQTSDSTSTGDSLPGTQNETQFQAYVHELPPIRWIRPPRPRQRMSISGKLFIAGIVMFAISYLMETYFRVG